MTGISGVTAGLGILANLITPVPEISKYPAVYPIEISPSFPARVYFPIAIEAYPLLCDLCPTAIP